ncbi:MAG: sugar-binding domain-containing protein [Paracoccaceae bacterium]|nr:sugar-binding domain-containing protein [Paracoccaceae bacterium]
MTDLTDPEKMTRAAWLYHVAGLNQEATAERLGLTRARVNKLLQAARETGIVSIRINERDLGLLKVEEAIRARFGLGFCVATPALGTADTDAALRMVGVAGAGILRERLGAKPEAVIGTGWGRTLAHLSRQMAGISAPQARFISLMGSLTANAAVNPFDVVHALAQATGGSGYFLPVPFIADSAGARETLLAQQAVRAPLALAQKADLALISVGELTEASLLRREGTISARDVETLRAAGAVGDTNGIFFDRSGAPVDHPLNARSIAVGLDRLREMETVLLSGGRGKIDATRALLGSGAIAGLVIDGDSAIALADAETG